MGLRDCTFTPSGILVISWDMIAEANFDDAPQSSSNLSNWTTFQATTTNVNFQMSFTNSQHYFRALAPY
jgi:hypothetical protein